jgi:hypothetical protein
MIVPAIQRHLLDAVNFFQGNKLMSWQSSYYCHEFGLYHLVWVKLSWPVAGFTPEFLRGRLNQKPPN